MHVVMYKILNYLYKCMKSGKDVDPSKISFESLGINSRYWTSVMMELIELGYVKGYVVSRFDDTVSLIPGSPHVTLSGVEFLMENSLMAKARDFIVGVKDFMPSPF